MGTEDEHSLTMQGRATAAAGAALVAACIVNPLDVIKTRIQAQAMSDSLGQRGCSTPWTCHSTLYERWGITEGPLPIRRTPPFPTPSGWVPTPVPAAAAAAAASPAAAAAAAAVRGAACGCAPLHQPLPAAATASARAVARAGAGAPPGGQQSMWDVARAISAREGVPVLWRGTWASLLIAVPMVGIYMPLYDALLASWSGNSSGGDGGLGSLAPVASGTAARTVACFCVAPFELLRTRLQASAATGASMRSTISSLVAEHHHHHHQQQHQQQQQQLAASSSSGGRPVSQLLVQQQQQQPPMRAGAVLRAVPRMWTGFSATLVRDVPFSALYWALVEPLRQAMLPVNSHWKPLEKLAARHHQRQQQKLQQQQLEQQQQQQRGGRAVVPASQQHLHHTQLEILIANLVSGCVAGGLAAAATTPFDVVKTRMQIATPSQQQQQVARAAAAAPGRAAGAGGGLVGGFKVLRILRDVYRQEGLEGLFAGVKPRAYRAAPACGIVISVYELLKSYLTPAD